MSILLEVRDVSKTFNLKDGVVKACNRVNLKIHSGEILGLVGESGSGKTTMSNLILGLEKPDQGEILFKGQSVVEIFKKDEKIFRRGVQAVFQQPLLALDSLQSIERSVTEPLIVHGVGDRASRKARVRELFELVGLDESFLQRYPNQLSGGQLQRVNIARALVLSPELLICDEAVSALDVSVQAQIINLFLEIQSKLGVALLFISHDLEVVRYLADRIAVMYAGSVVEESETDSLVKNPLHPYSRALLSASSIHESSENDNWDMSTFRREELPEVGCKFATRCRYVDDFCRENEPVIQGFDGDRHSACFKTDALVLRGNK
jgi:oligopeptide/dipeptide ABC transporter ATP-binding protein